MTRQAKILIFGLASIIILGGGGFGIYWLLNSNVLLVKAADVVESVDQGEINWTQGYIEAIGRAVPPDNITSAAQGKELARRGAIVDAQRRLIEIIKGVRIEGKTTMVNLMANDIVRQRVEGFVRNAEIVPASESWDGEVYSLRMRIPLYKPTVPQEKVKGESNCTAIRQSQYTGLVIDATGTSLTPQVLFSIFDTDGKLIYGAAKAFYQPVADAGLVKFTSAMSVARRDPRVGENPLVIKAVAAGGEFNTNVIVSVDDGKKLIQEFDCTDIFTQAKIIVVID